MDATTVAVGLAKDVFELAVANQAYRIVDRRRLTRRQYEGLLDGVAAGTTVVMEACGTAGGAAARCVVCTSACCRAVRPGPYVRRNKTDSTEELAA